MVDRLQNPVYSRWCLFDKNLWCGKTGDRYRRNCHDCNREEDPIMKTILIASEVSYFPDDLTTLCEECGRTLFFRPYWKEKIDSNEMKVLCVSCAGRYSEGEEPMVPAVIREELKNLGITDEKIEAALIELTIRLRAKTNQY